MVGTGSKILLKPGDTVRMVTGTGGGYGNPLNRDPARVAMDVKNGYITPKDAEEVYGVLVDGSGNNVLGFTEARAMKT